MNGNFNLILDKFCINNYLLSNAEKNARSSRCIVGLTGRFLFEGTGLVRLRASRLSLGVDTVVEDLRMRAGMRHLKQDAIRGVRLTLHDGNAVVFAEVKIAAILIVGELDTHRTAARHHFDATLVLQIVIDRFCRDLGGQTLGDRRQKVAMVHLGAHCR